MRAPRRSPEEWKSILERFKVSGLSQAAFCEKEEIKVCTLRYWLYRPAKVEPQFVPVDLEAQGQLISRNNRLAMIRIAGISMEVDVRDFARVLHILAE